MWYSDPPIYHGILNLPFILNCNILPIQKLFKAVFALINYLCSAVCYYCWHVAVNDIRVSVWYTIRLLAVYIHRHNLLLYLISNHFILRSVQSLLITLLPASQACKKWRSKGCSSIQFNLVIIFSNCDRL